MWMARRLLLLWALMFWQGGFMFYGGVVVPVGSRILGSDLEQGWITRSVTSYLNVAGAVALALWGWDLLAEPASFLGRRRLRWLSWCLLVLALGMLVRVHMRLEELLDLEQSIILDRSRFRSLHRRYLAVSTAQWLGCITLSALTIRAWHDGDALPSDRAEAGTSPDNQ